MLHVFVLKNDIVMFNKFSNMVSKNSEPVKSACEKLKEEMGTRGLIGAYIPRCTEYGEFERKQCHGSTGECWCVDSQGRQIEDTRRKAQKVDCSMCKY